MGAVLLKGGRILDPARQADFIGDLLVEDGKIAAVDRSVDMEGARVVDVSRLWICPGLVDIHVHLREPGEEYKETIETGTKAAAAGGFTAVACMPNTSPPNDNSCVTKFIKERAREAGHCRVYPVACITKGQNGEELTEFGDLLASGAVAFSDDGYPVRDAVVMRMALEYAQGYDALVISHSEELSLSAGGCMNEGRISTLLGLKGIPSAAEEIAVFRDIRLADLTGSRLHIAHVSTAGAVEVVRRAKERGVRVTAETAPHYFSLTEEAVTGYNTNAKMNPPLRTETDRQAIIQGLKDGTIDAIATDHAPHSVLEKDCSFEVAANGIVGLETALPLALSLVRQGHLDPLDVVRLISLSPSRILGIDAGTLEVGADADITIVDPEEEFLVTEESLFSKGKNTPFLGQRLKGRAVLTLLGGRPVHDPRAMWPGERADHMGR